MQRFFPSLHRHGRLTYGLVGAAGFTLLGWLAWLGYQQPDVLIAFYQGMIGCW